MFFFNEEDIDEIFFTGFKNEEEEEYQKIVDDTLETINYPRLQLDYDDVEKDNKE